MDLSGIGKKNRVVICAVSVYNNSKYKNKCLGLALTLKLIIYFCNIILKHSTVICY